MISQDPIKDGLSVMLLVGKPQGYAQATVSTTAIALPSIPASCDRVVIMFEDTGNVRWRDDGTDPTATVGMFLYAGQTIELAAQKSITQFKVIRQGTADVTMNVSYYTRS